MLPEKHVGTPGFFNARCECEMCEAYARIMLERPSEALFDEYD